MRYHSGWLTFGSFGVSYGSSMLCVLVKGQAWEPSVHIFGG